MLRSILVTSLFLLMWAPAPAVLGGEPEDIAELVTLTGIDTLFENVAGAWSQAAPSVTDERVREAWAGAVHEAIDEPSMRKQVIDGYTGAFSEAERKTLLNFYRSDFGRRVSAMETAGQRDGARGIKDGEALLSGAPAGRRALLLGLSEIEGNQSAEDGFIDSLRVLMLSEVLATARGGSPIQWDQVNARIDAQINKIAAPILPKLKQEQQAMIAHMYSDLSDDELGRYKEFLGTPEAKKFYRVLIEGAASANNRAMAVLGTSFVARLNSIGA